MHKGDEQWEFLVFLLLAQGSGKGKGGYTCPRQVAESKGLQNRWQNVAHAQAPIRIQNFNFPSQQEWKNDDIKIENLCSGHGSNWLGLSCETKC